MSRIGKAIINIPAGVEITVNDQNIVKVKGPKGELQQQLDPFITVSMDNGILTVKRETEAKMHKARHGLYRALIMNMVVGVSKGYQIEQELIGVGYRATANKNILELSLGYSHPIAFQIPPEVKMEAITEKGKPPRIVLQSHDKQLIGQVAAKIRSFRKPEPYKGKGIRFVGEQLRRKAGKAAAKS